MKEDFDSYWVMMKEKLWRDQKSRPWESTMRNNKATTKEQEKISADIRNRRLSNLLDSYRTFRLVVWSYPGCNEHIVRDKYSIDYILVYLLQYIYRLQLSTLATFRLHCLYKLHLPMSLQATSCTTSTGYTWMTLQVTSLCLYRLHLSDSTGYTLMHLQATSYIEGPHLTVALQVTSYNAPTNNTLHTSTQATFSTSWGYTLVPLQAKTCTASMGCILHWLYRLHLTLHLQATSCIASAGYNLY